MRWYEMKGQPNRDSNTVPPSQETNHATNWANEAGLGLQCMRYNLLSDDCYPTPELAKELARYLANTIAINKQLVNLDN